MAKPRFIPGPDLRLNQYRLNKVSLGAVQGLDRCPNDWAVTITFYAALHLVEKSLIAKIGKSYRKHEDRTQLVIMDEVLGEEVADAYQALFNDCLVARYNCVPISNKQVTDAIQNLSIIEQELA